MQSQKKRKQYNSIDKIIKTQLGDDSAQTTACTKTLGGAWRGKAPDLKYCAQLVRIVINWDANLLAESLVHVTNYPTKSVT